VEIGYRNPTGGGDGKRGRDGNPEAGGDATVQQ
jgi:hypothetical protein